LNFQPSGQGHREFITGAEHLDDFSRDVYGVLGIPIDAADLSAVVQRIGAAMRQDRPFLISTPNLNFLVTSQSDSEFRESLLQSDLCPVDGAPIVWISRLLGIPLQMRVAGSDIFDRLKLEQPSSVEVFLFGGPEGVAETCSAVLNSQSSGVVCVGTLYPGFGSVEHMSTEAIIEAINASDARLIDNSPNGSARCCSALPAWASRRVGGAGSRLAGSLPWPISLEHSFIVRCLVLGQTRSVFDRHRCGGLIGQCLLRIQND